MLKPVIVDLHALPLSSGSWRPPAKHPSWEEVPEIAQISKIRVVGIRIVDVAWGR